MTALQPDEEWRRLAAARSVAAVIAAEEDVTGFSALTGNAVPLWIKKLPLPDGWRLVEPSQDIGATLARIALWPARNEARFAGAETLQAFALTGLPWFAQLVRKASGVLVDLGARDITTKALSLPPGPGRLAMRSTGLLSSSERLVWAQYSFFLAASETPGAGRLVEHQLLVDAEQLHKLGNDIVVMSDAVHSGFISTLEVSAGRS